MRNLEIKDRIIRETKTLLMKKGSVTIKDIADACYMNIASVNYYFGSKEILINEVVSNVIKSLKSDILVLMENLKGQEKAVVLEAMIGYTYQYALDNMGVLNYLFLSTEMQKSSSNLLIETFFTDNDFTRLIFKEIMLDKTDMDEQTLYAKYMIIFSSFAMPLFISLSTKDSKKRIETFKDETFRNVFIKQLLKVME